MTTKLIKKLTYLKDTTRQINEALKQKGALIDEKMPFRQVVQEIEKLKTNKDTKFALSPSHKNTGERSFIIHHFDKALKDKNGSLTGSFNGYFSTLGASGMLLIGDYLIFTNTSGSNNWRTYLIDKQEKIFTPYQQKTESLVKDQIIPNPVQKNVIGGFYFKKTDLEGYPTGTLSYPANGVNSSFNKASMVWDSSGTYLINLAQKSTGVDVLKLVPQADEGFAYELVTSIDTASLLGNDRVHSFAPADNNTPNSFCLFGRYIYQINPQTGELSFQDMDQASLPTNGVILLYGKNYLVLKSEDTSTNPTITFLKATPIDETLAGEEAGFFQNPSNYTFEIMHQADYQNVPTKALVHANGGYFSPINNVKDYFIKPLNENPTSLQDFAFCFERETSLSDDVTGLFYDEETFISKGGSSDLDCPALYQKNPTTHLFEKEDAPMHLRTLFLSEYGGGAFNTTGNTKEYFFKDGQLDTKTNTNGSNYFHYELFLKNGAFMGYVSSGNTIYGKMFRASTQTLYLNDYCCNIVNDEMISNLNADHLYKIEDTGSFTTYTAEGVSFKSSNAFVIEKEGLLFAIHPTKKGVDVDGSLYQLTLHPETKTFTSLYVAPIKCTLEKSYWHVGRKLKTAPVLITPWGYCYGFYSGAEDGILRFVEKELPDEIYAYKEESPISYIQTFYDGSVALQLLNGKTLHFFLEWNEQTGTPSLKEGTTLDVFEPLEMNGENLNIIFSPLKRYQFVYSNNISQIRLSPFASLAPNEKDTAYHLEPISTNTLTTYPNASTCISTGGTKTIGESLLLTEVEFG